MQSSYARLLRGVCVYYKTMEILKEKKMRLHLGCGENYIKGYVNVDLPPSEHTMMRPKADVYQDIRTLEYAEGSVAEVRAHHLLEHFSRQEALRILLQWRGWLEVGGVLFVETPDFETSVKQFIEGDLDVKFAVARHIFGSQESGWAFHRDWWGEEKYRFILPLLGFEIFELRKELAYLGSSRIPFVGSVIKRSGMDTLKNATGDRLANIVVKARKTSSPVDVESALRSILGRSLVGSEREILEVWMREGK